MVDTVQRRGEAVLNKCYDGNGSLHSQLGLGYVVPYLPSAVDLETLLGAPCDGVQVSTDDYSVAYVGPDGVAHTAPGAYVDESPDTVSAGWTDGGDGTYTHAAGITTLDWDDRLTIGAWVLVKYTVSGMTAGTVTAGAGITSGAATAADASVVEILEVDTDAGFTFTPTTTFDGVISAVEVLPISPAMKAGAMSPLRCSKVEMVLDAAFAEAADEIVHLGWYRQPSV